jgi:hypothetical protein
MELFWGPDCVGVSVPWDAGYAGGDDSAVTTCSIYLPTRPTTLIYCRPRETPRTRSVAPGLYLYRSTVWH